jgi:hypothetical protein
MINYQPEESKQKIEFFENFKYLVILFGFFISSNQFFYLKLLSCDKIQLFIYITYNNFLINFIEKLTKQLFLNFLMKPV